MTHAASQLDPQARRGVASYEVTDQSLMIGIYRRFLWDPLVAHIPARITPNTLTVAAQCLGVVSAACAIAASRGAPGLYGLAALCIFASLTLDNVDGAHARRTGQTSPRGELLDHGLDGVTSTSVLVSTGLLLHLDAVGMALLSLLGALTFASTFWEQSRTGRLILPSVGPTEGVTALVVVEILVALFGDPSWLRVSRERVTFGTVLVGIVVAVHAVAVVPPLVRARRLGFPLRELAPLGLALAGLFVFVLLGAPGPLVGGLLGLTCAHFVCHLVVARHRGEGHERGLPRPLWLSLVPLPVAALVPSSASACAFISLLVAIVAYARTLHGGWRLLATKADPS